MPLPRHRVLSTPGRYRVKVIRYERTHTKKINPQTGKGDPKLVLFFADNQGREIMGSFVPRYPKAKQALMHLKNALGLLPDAEAKDFVGRECIIQVEYDQRDSRYTNICGYFPPDSQEPGDETGFEAQPTVPEEDWGA